MNIGIVTTWFERGAAYVSRQYRQVLEHKHQVFIYARGGEAYSRGDPIWDDPQVTWGKQLPFVGRSAIDRSDFHQWVLRNHITMVIFNEQDWWPPVFWCNEWGVRTGGYVDYYTEDTIPFFGGYDFLLCNTQRHYSAFNWHPHCFYIPWGTDTDLFHPRAPTPVESDRLVFFHSCGMSPRRKGTDLVIEALDQLDDSARLIVHAQQPMEKQLPHLAPTIGRLTESGKLVYRTETVPAPGLYHLGDVYVYPSRLEGIGLTIAEALACGLPVITTDHPPMNEFVQSGVNGQLVAVQKVIARADGYYWPQAIVDNERLAQAMQYYIDKRADLERFKERARLYAESCLNWSSNAEQLSELLDQVAKQPEQVWREAEQRALAYERARMQLQQMYPRLFYGLHLLWRPIKVLRAIGSAI